MTETGNIGTGPRRTMNLAHMLTQQSLRRPNEAALIWGDRQLSWAALNGRVDALAAGLSYTGVGKGDRVLVQAKNGNEILETMYACFRLGAVWVPMNWRLAPREVAELAAACRPVAMICHAEFAPHAAKTQSSVPSLQTVIHIEKDAAPSSYEAIIAQHDGHVFQPAPVYEGDPCWFFCTSDTTGTPKVAILTHSQMAFVITNHVADLMPGLSDGDVSLVIAPLSHGAGVHHLVQTARGVKSILLSKEQLDPADVWQLVERWRVTNLFAVPTIVKTLVESESVDRYDHATLRQIVYAGAPMYREDQKKALTKLGKVLVQYFGLGEVTGNITVLPADLHCVDDTADFPHGSCGFERTGMQVEIFDHAGTRLPAGTAGEICVCGPAVFAGYFENPSANTKAFRDGWFRTGDVGYLDERGFLYITGRLSDMYITGGSNVYPREIEEQLMVHSDIQEAAVLGIPDSKWGETGIAVVVLRKESDCGEADLISFLQQRMARYKVPSKFAFVDALPKSAYGKVLKSELQKQLLSGQIRVAV